jgi:hypothetical protein
MLYFVTEAYIKLNTPVTANVDITDFNPLIKTAADTFVRSVLGTYFYNHLVQEYNAQTLNNDEITLVQDFIQPAVAWRVCAESAITLSYQLKNKGIQKQSGDFSAASDMKETAFIFHHYRDRADFYDQRIIDYLIENKALYPQFTDKLNFDTIVPGWPHCSKNTGRAFQSGINIISKNNSSCYGSGFY